MSKDVRPYKTDVISSDESIAYSKKNKAPSIENFIAEINIPSLPSYIREQFYKPND